MQIRLICICFLLSIAGFCFSGCSANKDESNIPWSRPASWEGQAPGMGDISPGRDRY